MASPALESTTCLPGDFDYPDESPPVEDVDMTYEQLREAYDNEEIDRFIDIFSMHVTEVRIPQAAPYNLDTGSTHNLQQTVLEDAQEGDSWITLYDASEGHSLSAEIAHKFVLPYLPPPAPPPPVFTFGRLRVATERLYLSLVSIYVPFLVRLFHLATWKNKYESGLYCAAFWMCWYYDSLIPAFLLRLFYSLVRRRIFPYPTLEELRARRQDMQRADDFGNLVSSRLAASSSLGVKEMWRLFKVVNKGKKTKIKKVFSQPQSSPVDRDDDTTVLDNDVETKEERDLKRLGLQLLTGLVDLHERIKNLFIWRRPQASRIFAALILMSFFTTLLLPTRLVMKLIYFVPGFIFWHVVPVVASMNAEERARLPPPLVGVPTDAEYAMEVISMRVASGLDIKSSKRTRGRRSVESVDRSHPDNCSTESKDESKKSVDWQKWSDRAAIGKAWAGEGKRLIKKGAGKSPSSSPIIPIPAIAIGQSPKPESVYTYPCQYGSTPGLITLTPTMFYFTSFLSTNPTCTILLNRLQGAKKTGLMKGLTLKWAAEEGGQQNEEVFRWVGNRDELFARLIGLEGKRWLKA
ncbi:hypothetical protein BDZ89DRAFT_1059025 [Hymenopellis radicata]|nr:hypothetical protein BDZ89DRAFT_1059025 [Hymenopellis radicata]